MDRQKSLITFGLVLFGSWVTAEVFDQAVLSEIFFIALLGFSFLIPVSLPGRSPPPDPRRLIRLFGLGVALIVAAQLLGYGDGRLDRMAHPYLYQCLGISAFVVGAIGAVFCLLPFWRRAAWMVGRSDSKRNDAGALAEFRTGRDGPPFRSRLGRVSTGCALTIALPVVLLIVFVVLYMATDIVCETPINDVPMAGTGWTMQVKLQHCWAGDLNGDMVAVNDRTGETVEIAFLPRGDVPQIKVLSPQAVQMTFDNLAEILSARRQFGDVRIVYRFSPDDPPARRAFLARMRQAGDAKTAEDPDDHLEEGK